VDLAQDVGLDGLKGGLAFGRHLVFGHFVGVFPCLPETPLTRVSALTTFCFTKMYIQQD